MYDLKSIAARILLVLGRNAAKKKCKLTRSQVLTVKLLQ